jgi:hypothetical protein
MIIPDLLYNFLWILWIEPPKLKVIFKINRFFPLPHT